MDDQTDKKKFATYMAMLGTAFGERGILPERIDIYWENLCDLPIEMIGRAVLTIIRTRKYSSIPTIAEIREAVLGKDEDIEAEACRLWTEATIAMAHGVMPPNPETKAAICAAFGSWEQFGQMSLDNEMADRAHFIRVFKHLARQKRERGEKTLEEPRVARIGRVVHGVLEEGN